MARNDDRGSVVISTPGVRILTTECEKLAAVAADSNRIGNFLDWLREKGIVLAESHKHSDGCYSEGYRRPRCELDEGDLIHAFEKLLAEYFEIDMDAVERERRAMLDALHDSHKPPKTIDPQRPPTQPYRAEV